MESLDNRFTSQVDFKNKEIPQYLHDLVTLKNDKYNFRYSNTAHIPTVKTTHMD
jgi:hypothetical protein